MATMQWDFLKESEISLGVFYPLHYIIAGYANMSAAKEAEEGFRQAGKPSDDVRAATGDFVTAQLESRDEASWLEQAESTLVKFAGTELGYVHEDKAHARDGGAFLFVYAPDDESVAAARQVFKKYPPAYARRYLRIAIENVIENPDAL